ncbi:MAG: tRNA uridine-5-carboxymethylaminomethyl(34) synthesis GTPase MnmE, partial [Desulfopila sp.]|nr:tRNA uridine-5-carboxymethylaminomethyl(34) synthesis GTPase MnmE [Desulfopila sp.]
MDTHPSENTTVAAISTPPGSGGIGIIRISGPGALAALKTLFSPHKPNCDFRSHHFFYGTIVDPLSRRVVDEVLVVYMASPRTYTREDVVEIHCHSSFLVLQNILELLFQQGVEPAQPGEFTKRAFLNGRIDLTRAEAVIDILAAKTRKGIDIAQEQLAGALYGRVDIIRKVLRELRALVEVSIDFPDEDVEILHRDHMLERVKDEVAAPIDYLLRCSDRGRIYREGVSAVIVGRPNVGKSSLLNSLLQEDRALVTAVPGTTRDSIEEHIDVMGMPVRIIDTAGIRDHADEVEELGIRRAKRLVNQADVVLFMVDGAAAVTDEDHRLFSSIAHKTVMVVINKVDLLAGEPFPGSTGFADTLPQVRISAKLNSG